jgi:hypothetical protein
MQFLEKLKPLGLLALRLALAATFIYNGYPKLAEPARWLKAFPSMGFPSYFAYISGILDVLGGVLLGVIAGDRNGTGGGSNETSDRRNLWFLAI